MKPPWSLLLAVIETGMRQENWTAPLAVGLDDTGTLVGADGDGVRFAAVELDWLQPTNSTATTATQSFMQA